MKLSEQRISQYIQVLESECIPALGCTEPIALALAAAKAKELLGDEPILRAHILCSGNIVKNVKGVTVPFSGNRKGIIAAAALGIAGGDANAGLEVLAGVSEEHRKAALALEQSGIFSCDVQENEENLFISIILHSAQDCCEVVIAHNHTEFIKLRKNDTILFEKEQHETASNFDELKKSFTVEEILAFATTVDLECVHAVLQRQIQNNSAIATYGLEHSCGSCVGKSLLSSFGQDNVSIRAAALAAAGSDARMSGCPLPVVVNSGSGNQGLTVSLPVIEYANSIDASQDKLYRALLISNLIAIHQKVFLGKLSAFCGAVNAAAGSAAAICWLRGGNLEEISYTISNTLATVGGMLCDGAKASCAAKIATAVFCATLSGISAQQGNSFAAGDGLVQNDVEETIACMGYVGKHGMKQTDDIVLQIMTDKITF